MSDSTFSANRAADGSGGGIANTYYGTVTVSNCTFTNNVGDRTGGGIANGLDNYFGTMTVSNSVSLQLRRLHGRRYQ